MPPQPYSSAAQDLGVGLGTELTNKLQKELQDRQKMKKLQGTQQQSPYNVNGLATAAQSLGLAPNIAR